MAKPTVFVDKMGEKEGDPIRMAVKMISHGATVVDEFLTADDVEADIIVVNSAAKALRFLKETEKSVIAIFVFPKSEVAAANALAERYPDRVRAMSWEQFTLTLIALITEMTKEETDADPARG